MFKVTICDDDAEELAHLIRKTDKTAVIIFLTSHEGRALDAYRVRAAQYLTKPISRETLRGELDIALGAAREKKGKKREDPDAED